MLQVILHVTIMMIELIKQVIAFIFFSKVFSFKTKEKIDHISPHDRRIVSSVQTALPLLTIKKRISMNGDINVQTKPRNIFGSSAIEYQLIDHEDNTLTANNYTVHQ